MEEEDALDGLKNLKPGQKPEPKDKDVKVGIYKSLFLREKVEQQTEKRKRDRKIQGAARAGAGSPRASAAGGESAVGGGKKKAPARGKTATENEEHLQQVIDDLRNDLRLRDEEYTDQQNYLHKIQKQNEYLKKELRATQLSKITVESKLAKITTMKQLDANFAMIEKNHFFENRSNKISQLNANLSNSVKEQHKSSLSISYAAKYARIWLKKVRERKATREMAAQANGRNIM